MKPTIYLLLLYIITLLGCASQDDVILLDERLAILEVQLSRLKEQYSEVKSDTQKREAKDQNMRTQSAGLRVQIENLREEIQILNGKLEEIEFLVKKEGRHSEAVAKKTDAQLLRLTEITNANKDRLKSIETYLDLGTQGAKTVSTVTTEGEKQEPLSQEALYKSAKQAFDKGDFDTARERFQDFIDKYPKSRNADNAQFWIGEIYYREKWYEKAILEYQKVIENYPRGNKVRASLLKQGYAFHNIGDKSNARIILKELIRKYPNSNEAKIAQNKLATIK